MIRRFTKKWVESFALSSFAVSHSFLNIFAPRKKLIVCNYSKIIKSYEQVLILIGNEM